MQFKPTTTDACTTDACTAVLDTQRLDTYVTATKIELTAAQSALSWAMTAVITALAFAAVFVPWYTDAAVFPIAAIVLGHFVFIILPDYFLLPYMKRNIARVEAVGMPRWTWMGHVAATLCLLGVFAWVPPGLFGVGLGATPRLTVELIVKAVALAILSDIPAYLLHGYMHRKWPDAHMLHHYCIDVSLTSSYFIEASDLVMEFVLPLMAISLGLLDDPWLYLTTHAITTTWYILSHDPQLKLPHYYHHTQRDSRYNAYVPVKPTYDPADQVRKTVVFARAAIVVGFLASLCTAVSPYAAGGLTFAEWTKRSGAVTHGTEHPPGPWASFQDPADRGTPRFVTADASIPRENMLVSVGTSSPTSFGTPAVTARDADTGAVRWVFNDTDVFGTEFSWFAFVGPYQLSAINPFGPATYAVAVGAVIQISPQSAQHQTRVILLHPTTGQLLSRVELQTAIATTPSYNSAQQPGTSTSSVPVPPFVPRLMVMNVDNDFPTMTLMSSDLTTGFALRSERSGAGLRVQATAQCPIMPSGEADRILTVAHRGGGRIVFQCQQRVIEVDVIEGGVRTVNSSVSAITTLEHSAMAEVTGAPLPAIAAMGLLQDVFFAAYSTLQNSIVVGVVDFDLGHIVERGTVDGGQSDVRSVRVFAKNVGTDSNSAPAAIVIQTARGLVAVVPAPTAPPASPPRWTMSWTTTFEVLIATGIALEGLPANDAQFRDVGVATVLPTAAVPSSNSTASISTPAASSLLSALRIGTSFFVIDVLARRVVWSASSSGSSSCYSGTVTSGVRPLHPLFASVTPALDAVMLGCPAAHFVVALPDMAAYSGGVFTSSSSTAPFTTRTGSTTSVSTIPLLFTNTLITSQPDRILASYTKGVSYSIAARAASAVLDGVTFTLSPSTSKPALLVAVGAGGQELWRREDLPSISQFSTEILQPFGPYLVAALENWHLRVLNASTGATIKVLTMPYECSAGRGNNFQSLAFQAFIAMSPSFAQTQRSGLPTDAVNANAVVFSFGVCEYALDRSLTLRLVNLGQQTNSYTVRIQLNATHFVSLTSANAMRLYDLSDVTAPRLVWEVLPVAFTALNTDGIVPDIQLVANILVMVTSNTVSTLLVDTGVTLWMDSQFVGYGVTFFQHRTLGVFGDTIVVTTSFGVWGYHVGTKPVNQSAPHGMVVDGVHYGSSPQQVQWRALTANFSQQISPIGKLSQYGRYIITQGTWVAALAPATGAVVWVATVPPPSWGSYPQGFFGLDDMTVAENIVIAVFEGYTDAMWMLDESTGALLQFQSAKTMRGVTFFNDRLAFRGFRAHYLTVATWPTYVSARRILPVAPRPVPFPPTSAAAVPADFQRPTYAPVQPSIPDLPPASVNVTMPPKLWWSTSWNVKPAAGIFAPLRALIHFNIASEMLFAMSLDDVDNTLWSVNIPSCYNGVRDLDVSEEVGVAVITCPHYFAGFNATTGELLWNAPTAPAFKGTIIPPSSETFGGRAPSSASPRGIVLAVRYAPGGSSSVITGLDAVSGNATWTTTVANCRAGRGAPPSISGPSSAAARGESSQRFGDNVIECMAGTYIIVDPATGKVTRLTQSVAGSVRQSKIAALDVHGTTVRMVDVATGASTSTIELAYPLGSSLAIAASETNAVVFDSVRNEALFLGVTANRSTIIAFSINNATNSSRVLWTLDTNVIALAAGVARSELYSTKVAGFSQPEVEEGRNTVLVFTNPSNTHILTQQIARVSLRDGSVLIAKNITDPNYPQNYGTLDTFAVYTPPTTSTSAGTYAMMTEDYTTVFSIDTLSIEYVNSAFTYSKGFGALGFLPARGSLLESLVFVAQGFSNHNGRIIGRWHLKETRRSLISDRVTPISTVDDGSGDLIGVQAVTKSTSTDTYTWAVLVRRAIFGASSGELKWNTTLPLSLRSSVTSLANYNFVVSDTAVVFFTLEGVTFYDLVTGAATTFIPQEVLQTQCPMNTQRGRTVFTVDPNGADPTIKVQTAGSRFAYPASSSGVLVLQFGACFFVFNTKREMATYRVPYFSGESFLQSFTLHVPTTATAADPPALTAVFRGVLEKWNLPVDFLAPRAHGAPLPTVNYRVRVPISLAWTTDLQMITRPYAATSLLASNTVFVSDPALTAAVDIRSGKLLWRFTEFGNSNVNPLRIYNGYLFLVSAPSSQSGPRNLVVLDAFSLAPAHRVVKLIPLLAQSSEMAMSTLLSDRVIAFQSNTRILGLDVVSLDVLWNVTAPLVPRGGGEGQSLLQAVRTTRDSPLFGAFLAAPYETTSPTVTLYDGTTGAVIQNVDAAMGSLQFASVTCTAAGPSQRCASLQTVTSGHTNMFVSIFPTSSVVPNKLPAPHGPAPTSPPVPAKFQYVDPTPKNMPPIPFTPNEYSPETTMSAATGPHSAYYQYATQGLLIYRASAIVAVNASTGAREWTSTFPSALNQCYERIMTMATDSPLLIFTFVCPPQAGIYAIVYDAATGAQVFANATADIEAPSRPVDRRGAVLGRTACHTFRNTTSRATGNNYHHTNGMVCYDVDTARVAMYHCPNNAQISDLRPNPTKTMIVMSCSGLFAYGIDVRKTTHAEIWSIIPEMNAGKSAMLNSNAWIPADVAAPTVSSIVLLAPSAKPNVEYDIIIADPDIGAPQVWSVNTSEIMGEPGLGAVTALSPRYVALQSHQREVVLDMFTRKVAFSKTSTRQYAICCYTLSCCGSLRMLPDGGGVVSVNTQRGTVASYYLLSNETNWETEQILSTGAATKFAATPRVIGRPEHKQRGIVLTGQSLSLLSEVTGEMIWSGTNGYSVVPTPTCVWSGSYCFGYVPPATLRTKNQVAVIFGIQNGLVATDNQNVYSMNLSTAVPGVPPAQKYVTPALGSGVSSAVLFGGPMNERFLVSRVNGRWWIFDVENSMTAVHAFEFPLDVVSSSGSRGQFASIGLAVAHANEHGGALYLPGLISGVLAIYVSTSGPTPTFSTKFWQTNVTVSAKLSIYKRDTAKSSADFPHRTCGVAVPLGGGVAMVDCVRMTPWWRTPTPASPNALPALISGDYLVYLSDTRLDYSSAITGQTVWRSVSLPFLATQPLFLWNNTVFSITVNNARGYTSSVVGFELAFEPTAPAVLEKTPVITISDLSQVAQFIFARGLVILLTYNGATAVSLSTGANLWANENVLVQNTVANIEVNGTLVMGTQNQNVVSVDLRSGNSSVFASGGYGVRLVAIPGTAKSVAPPSTSSLSLAMSQEVAKQSHSKHNTAQVINPPASVPTAPMYTASKVAVVLSDAATVASVTAAPPLPEARGAEPRFGVPPTTYPAASPADVPVPTLPPNAVVPSVGCVSRVVGASAEFVTCVDAVAAHAYTEASWVGTPPRPIFLTCWSTAASLNACAQEYLFKMSFGCGAGVNHLETLTSVLNASALFGQCPAGGGGGGQCMDPQAAQGLCEFMSSPISKLPGVGTLAPGKALAPGFTFPLPPSFAPPPRPPTTQVPTPAPTNSPSDAPTPAPTPAPQTTPGPTVAPVPTPAPVYSGLTTTFALRYAANVAPSSASDLAVVIQTSLGLDAEVVSVRILSLTGSRRSGEWSFFNVTSPNAQKVAGLLGARTEAENAAALGGVQFGLYFPTERPVATPPPGPAPSSFDVKYVAIAAVAAAVLSAIVAVAVTCVITRRKEGSARVGNGSLAGHHDTAMSHRELKSLQEGMLGESASPYQEA